MIAETMKPLIRDNATILAMFEEGKKLKAAYGEENVFDFSIGNPNVPAPPQVEKAIREILAEEDSRMVHGYMSNAGFEDVRHKIAQSINRRQGTNFSAHNLVMTTGAAGGLNIALQILLNPGDEVVVFAPYFLEYGAYVSNYQGKLVVVSSHAETFMPNLEELGKKITERTKVVIINTPHNPTGVIYSEETICALAEILKQKEREVGHAIVLLSDEPYRELAYHGAIVPYVTKYYPNTIVVYSYSKSLSLPGERIGYLVLPDELEESKLLQTAASIAIRVNGMMNAPSLMQRVIGRCVDVQTDISYYERNRNVFYQGILEAGFSCVPPEGAFYLFVKSPVEDEKEFCAVAREYNILMVPGSSFAWPGYVRLAYCVSYETIVRSLPYFQKMGERYREEN